MLLVLLRKGARSRSTDIKETFCGTTFTRDNSPTFMNVNLILRFRDFRDALYITAHRVANFIPEIGYHLISFEMIDCEIINQAPFISLRKLSFKKKNKYIVSVILDLRIVYANFIVLEFYFISVSDV